MSSKSDNNGLPTNNTPHRMTALKLLLFTIALGIKSNKGFYIPQLYSVRMYHRASMSISAENETEESSMFSLHVNNEEAKIELGLRNNTWQRIKRSQSSHEVSAESSTYEEDSLYSGNLESEDSSMDNQSYSYDYDKFKTEYYQEESPKNVSNATSSYEDYSEEMELTTEINLNKTRQKNTINANVPMENYCSVFLLFRIRVFECFHYGLSYNNDDITHKSGAVLVFWLIVYTLIASYLWCTRGWCCCCCPCACCHPHSVIHEAKQFLTQNPPGVAQLHSKRKVYYEPSEYEKDCYKRLENEVYNF